MTTSKLIYKKMTFPAKITPFVIHWLVQPFIAVFHPLLAVSLTLFALGLLVYFYLSKKLSAWFLVFMVISLFLAVNRLEIEIRKTIDFNRCFEFGTSYPGTKAFDECLKTPATREDYTKVFTSFDIAM